MSEIKRDAMNLDANESAFFKKQLEYVKSKTYDVKYAPNKALGLFPISTEAGEAASEITWRQYSKVGLARLVSDYAQDFPRVDIYGTETSVKIHEIGASYGYSIMEIRKAAMAGVPLETRRATVAREAIEKKLNTIALSGESTANITGFLDYTGNTEYTVASGVGGYLWSEKTADEILDDMNGIVESILTATNGIEQPDTMLMPLEQYLLIGRKRISDDSDGKTVLKYFLENTPYIKRIEWLTELKTAGTEDNCRFMVFKNDADHISFEIPVPFEQFEADKKALTYEIPCLARTAGIIEFYPVSCAYGDGI